MKCPECGKFLKDVTADINGFNEIISVEGFCKKHGTVEPTDWCYENFFPWPKIEKPLSHSTTTKENK